MAKGALADLLDLTGQVAIVTGASRGIGRAIAEVFGRAGAKLTLVARTPESLAAVAAGLGQEIGASSVLSIPADVAVESQVNEVVRRTVEAFGRVDILVNNAGLISAGSILKIEPADWDRVIGANLTGAYLFSRAVAPIMERQKGGRIINIASISAQTGGISGGVHYSSSKGGMIAMTKTLARDLAPFGVTVNAIAPGQIDTDPKLLTPESRQRIIGQIPVGRLGLPEDVAYATLFFVSPMASYITGTTLDVNGGLLKR